MSPIELRELADKLVDPSDTLFKFHMDQAAAYLRACADALEAGPVAWAATDETGKTVEALGMNGTRRFSAPLYLRALPAHAPVLRIPEPMTDGQLLDALIEASKDLARRSGRNPDDPAVVRRAVEEGLTIGRIIEAAILRRMKEANT